MAMLLIEVKSFSPPVFWDRLPTSTANHCIFSHSFDVINFRDTNSWVDSSA